MAKAPSKKAKRQDIHDRLIGDEGAYRRLVEATIAINDIIIHHLPDPEETPGLSQEDRLYSYRLGDHAGIRAEVGNGLSYYITAIEENPENDREYKTLHNAYYGKHSQLVEFSRRIAKARKGVSAADLGEVNPDEKAHHAFNRVAAEIQDWRGKKLGMLTPEEADGLQQSLSAYNQALSDIDTIIGDIGKLYGLTAPITPAPRPPAPDQGP